jgi:hypothetical protein
MASPWSIGALGDLPFELLDEMAVYLVQVTLPDLLCSALPCGGQGRSQSVVQSLPVARLQRGADGRD